MLIEFYCPICMELYQNTDYAYTTQCGHVFHQTCLQNWLMRSGTCPECRRMCSSSTILKIYIKSRNSEQLVEVQKQLDQKILTINELEDKLAVAEQEQLQCIRDKEFSKVLSESLENELNDKRLEIKRLLEALDLKEKNNAAQPTIEKICEKDEPANNLNICESNKEMAKNSQLIKDLERKLGEKTLELEKEIRNSTMLIVEQMKLKQQLIDAGISGTTQRGKVITADTNKLNQQVKKSLQNANTTVVGAAECAGAVGGAIKKRLEKPAFDLFLYTKKLHKAGVKGVFSHEGKIFIRKDESADKIQIFNKNQVDALFQHFKSLSTNTPQAQTASKPNKCDENYYAL